SVVAYLCFFFSSRRRHTRFSRDWSSDVCSSDLHRKRITQCCCHLPTWTRNGNGSAHVNLIGWRMRCSGRSVPVSGASRTLRRFLDRKSTRLNSSHVKISYAVFCLQTKTLTVLPG